MWLRASFRKKEFRKETNTFIDPQKGTPQIKGDVGNQLEVATNIDPQEGNPQMNKHRHRSTKSKSANNRRGWQPT